MGMEGFMQLKKMLADVSYEVLQGTLNRDVVDIAYDSRKVVRDGMFVAIEGTVQDGHAYIGKAVEAGACVIVAEKVDGDGRNYRDEGKIYDRTYGQGNY